MNESFESARRLFVEGVQDFEAGRFAGAEKKFRSSIALLPGRVSTLANLGATLIELSRPDEALIVLEQALAVEPDNTDGLCHRGVALCYLGRFEEAVGCFDRVVASDPLRAAAWFYRALALNDLQRHEETLASFDRFLAIEPGRGEAWLRRGQTLQLLDRHDDALISYERALAADPGLAQAWTNRGNILKDRGRPDEAAASFEKAIALGGDAELNAFFLAAAAGRQTPAAAPKQSVQDLFDDYAKSFDEHLVRVLQYRTPAVLAENLRALGSRRFGHALDLGCGTGLCGPLVKPVVDRLDGVDLSPLMLEKAGALGLYERLVHADVTEYLAATDQRYDLVLAADVFVYIGDLEPVFGGVARVMDSGGIFCFSAEIPEGGEDFELKSSLRYGHSERYIRNLASRHGFAVARILRGPLRVEGERPIEGLYAYLGS
jgi:predicted TPR repeat methyltransferase